VSDFFPALGLLLTLTVEVLGSLVMMFYVVKAWKQLLSRRPNRKQASLFLAEGAINSLSFKLAATILKLLYVHSWVQIGAMASVVALRTILKRAFARQQERLIASSTPIKAG
jgi:hypothetical protein